MVEFRDRGGAESRGAGGVAASFSTCLTTCLASAMSLRENSENRPQNHSGEAKGRLFAEEMETLKSLETDWTKRAESLRRIAAYVPPQGASQLPPSPFSFCRRALEWGARAVERGEGRRSAEEREKGRRGGGRGERRGEEERGREGGRETCAQATDQQDGWQTRRRASFSPAGRSGPCWPCRSLFSLCLSLSSICCVALLLYCCVAVMSCCCGGRISLFSSACSCVALPLSPADSV